MTKVQASLSHSNNCEPLIFTNTNVHSLGNPAQLVSLSTSLVGYTRNATLCAINGFYTVFIACKFSKHLTGFPSSNKSFYFALIEQICAYMSVSCPRLSPTLGFLKQYFVIYSFNPKASFGLLLQIDFIKHSIQHVQMIVTISIFYPLLSHCLY